MTDEEDYIPLLSEEADPPPEPTNAMPGTEDKISVMEQRVAAGFQAHHPADARMDRKGVVRVPVLNELNGKIMSWRVMQEWEYRRLDKPEPWWERKADPLAEICDYWAPMAREEPSDDS